MSRRTQPDVRALVAFLDARLTEDLARVWERDGTAAHVAVVDDLLAVLRSGGLPVRRELRILLYGYGSHPDYDPRWTGLLLD
jgi:hypothetical protein